MAILCARELSVIVTLELKKSGVLLKYEQQDSVRGTRHTYGNNFKVITPQKGTLVANFDGGFACRL